MIAQLTGTIIAAGATWGVVEVSGVGFRFDTNANTASGLRIGGESTVHTSLVVREDSLTLWGFETPTERDAFELVQTAQGVGPKVASAMLNVFDPGELQQVISREDVKRLTSVPGIGPKGAQKIIIELKDKILILGADGSPKRSAPASANDEWRVQVAAGLESLGWSLKDAERACDSVAHLADDDPDIGIAKLMRAALSTLAKR